MLHISPSLIDISDTKSFDPKPECNAAKIPGKSNRILFMPSVDIFITDILLFPGIISVKCCQLIVKFLKLIPKVIKETIFEVNILVVQQRINDALH